MASYRPSIKSDASGTTVDLPLDAETVKGKEVLATDGSVLMKGDLQFVKPSETIGLMFCAATDDYARVVAGTSGYNNGYLELATADDGNEPIYVRQYRGRFASVQRTATLLDGSGNTYFPGTVYSGDIALSKNTTNGFNPDNFNDGTKWLTHQDSQNAIGNSNRPLALFGTEVYTANNARFRIKGPSDDGVLRLDSDTSETSIGFYRNGSVSKTFGVSSYSNNQLAYYDNAGDHQWHILATQDYVNDKLSSGSSYKLNLLWSGSQTEVPLTPTDGRMYVICFGLGYAVIGIYIDGTMATYGGPMGLTGNERFFWRVVYYSGKLTCRQRSYNSTSESYYHIERVYEIV